MGDYDLSGLSARSFEQLIQAIASKVIGPGLVVFGDGPDGGREATFEGRIPFPSEADQWDGYCVIQAKFLQRPRDPKHDGRWALEQLRKELEAFADPAKRRKCPEYYIFATNVVLTAVQETGTKDRISQLFKKYSKRVPVRGWRTWDFDQIRTFLDGQEDIRRAYQAWISPGDVLAEVMAWLQTSRVDFGEVMANFLAKEMLADQYANLEQAGHSTEDRIPLARVFVDLPTSSERLLEPPEENAPRLPLGFAGEVVSLARERLDPASTSERRTAQEGEGPQRKGPEPGRVVLVGGPGQGKTTVGQFVCQLFRAALLRDRQQHLLSPETRQALEGVLHLCQQEKVEVPRGRRFPERIVLAEFAAALKAAPEQHPMSLLSYVADVIRKRTSQNVLVEDLRGWLAKYPWIIVLDGLDEVPASSNRDEVLKRVDDFWVDVNQANADVLVLATTRPQGYNEDFSPRYYRHTWLTPLSVPRAMHYAQRLVNVRYGSDEDRKRKVLSRLRQASAHDATARLMRSPLQVTIMATLVDQIGQPPQDRWRLFHEYYQVIYRRERERDIPAAQLLREHQRDIDTIHSRVALLLQVESERSGGTEARLSAERFAAVVDARLLEEEKDRTRLKDQIIEAAATRLVFLVAPQAGQVGFEIRSLQEFMAAESLMDGRDADVQNRLRQIAPIASWRNVFLFAAGRCFAETEHLRDTIHTICVDLNNDLAGPVGRATLAGSSLALDLLEDGVVYRQPKYAKLLARCALEILDLPPGPVHARLADVCEADLDGLFQEELQKRLTRPRISEALGAWAMLLALVGRGIPWAQQTAETHWPPGASEQSDILSGPTVGRAGQWVLPRIDACVLSTAPRNSWSFVHSLTEREGVEFDPRTLLPPRTSLPWLDVALWLRGFYQTDRPSAPVRLPGSADSSFELSFVPLANMDRFREGPYRLLEAANPQWVVFVETLRFIRDPSKVILAESFDRLASEELTTWDRVLIRRLPWVVCALVESCRTPDELSVTATRLRRGDLGDTPDWIEAERRWRTTGLTAQDFSHVTDDRWPFDGDIATKGFPFASTGWNYTGSVRSCGAMLRLYETLRNSCRLRAAVASWIFWFLGIEPRGQVFERLGLDVLTLLFEECSEKFASLDFVWAVARAHGGDPPWVDFLDTLGRRCKFLRHFRERPTHQLDEVLDEILQGHPDRGGIVRLMAEAVFEGQRWSTPRATRQHSLALRETLVDDRRFDDPSVKEAAIVVQLARVALTVEAANRLADVVCDLHASDRSGTVVDRAVRALATRDGSNDATDQFLLKIWGTLATDDSDARDDVLDGLNDSLSRRTSGLDRPETWNRLALPAGLVRLLELT